MDTLENRLDLIAARVGVREGFVAAVVGRLPKSVVEADDPITTAATNGSWIKFNRKFCDQLTNEELLGLFLHESYHCILLHMWRREGRDPAGWNYANDAIINRFLINKGYQLPKGGVLIDWVQETHDSEEVYAKLMKEAKGKGKGGGSPGAGGFDGQGDLQDAESEATLSDMEASIMAAAQMAKACGEGNSMIDRILKQGAQSNVSWKDEVRAILTSVARDDYSYRRPSKRFIAQRIYIPSLYSQRMGGLVIGFDTSGSMGERECAQVASEIQAIVDDLRPDWVEVVYCDSQVSAVERFNDGDAIELHPKGGGGTAFAPVFEHVAKIQEDGQEIAALIYLTDMEGDLNLPAPDYPVVWGLVYGRPQPAPFGHVVKVVT